MATIKISISLTPDVLEAVDATVKANGEKSRSALIERILRNDPDVWAVLEGMKT